MPYATWKTGQVTDDCSRMCFLSTGGVVVWGRTSLNQSFKFHFFSSTGNRRKTVQGKCKHDNKLHMLAIVIGGMEYLAVACQDCRNIKLLNVQDMKRKPIFAFKGSVGPMCLGKAGTLYILEESSGHISAVDCTKTKFTPIHQISNNIRAGGLCYMPNSKLIGISSAVDNTICALQDSGKVTWKTCSKEHTLSNIVYLRDEDKLVVAYNNRLSVVSSQDGAILHDIAIENDINQIYDLGVKDTHLVLTFGTDANELKLRFYLVSDDNYTNNIWNHSICTADEK